MKIKEIFLRLILMAKKEKNLKYIIFYACMEDLFMTLPFAPV